MTKAGGGLQGADRETRLKAVAFGDEPGAWPLPTAVTPQQLWLRAVAAGGQGRFASARADLAALLRDRPAGSLASLAHSTHGSLLRQLGWHALARGYDGRAALLADRGCRPAADAPEAMADALIGLAADALGVGRFSESAALLARSVDLSRVTGTHRLAIRHAWVSAELAMATGDGTAAVRHAERALELTDPVAQAFGAGSARHRVKSEIVLAAASCVQGDVDRARGIGDAALDAADRLGLVLLRWAVACLLADIGSATHTAAEINAVRDESVSLVHRRGGSWR